MCDTKNNKCFQPEVESVSEFLERFSVQNYKVINEDKDDKNKAMLLANALPVDVLTDIQRRLKPKKLSDAAYADLETQLTGLHSSKRSIIGASVAFLHRKQNQHESLESFAKSLNELASQCDYKDCCRDRMLRDQFVSGLKNHKIISNLIHEAETKKFHDLLEKAKLIEQLHLDVVDINPAAKEYQQNLIHHKVKHRVNKSVKRTQNSGNRSPKNAQNSRHYSPKSNKNGRTGNVSANYVCCRCGQGGSHLAKDWYASYI